MFPCNTPKIRIQAYSDVKNGGYVALARLYRFFFLQPNVRQTHAACAAALSKKKRGGRKNLLHHIKCKECAVWGIERAGGRHQMGKGSSGRQADSVARVVDSFSLLTLCRLYPCSSRLLIVVIYFELPRKLRIDHLLLLPPPPPPTFHIAGGRNGDWGRV